MKKTLIALAVLGSVAGVAQAQSTVTVYGKLDQGVRDLSNKNSSTSATNADSPVQLTHRATSRIGFKGTEDLGGGLSAIFQFENRFNADDGTVNGASNGAALFHAQSNVGLKGNFGTVRLGRVYNPVDDINAALDPFGQDGIGSNLFSPVAITRNNNAIRYDSTNFSGFSASAIYQLKEADVAPGSAIANNGYGVAANFANGPLSVMAGYNKAANSDDSHYWVIGGAYTFGPAKVSLGYEKSDIKAAYAPNGGPAIAAGKLGKSKDVIVGLTYTVGAGMINAAYSQIKFDNTNFTDKKLAIGYTHNLSKRTSLYANAARTDWGNAAADTTNGAEIGVTHNF